MDRFMGMRYEAFKIHASGHISVNLYRGDRGRCIAIATWRGMPMGYRVEPTDYARDHNRERPTYGTWAADLASAIKLAKEWE